jgi:hypothetical protein
MLGQHQHRQQAKHAWQKKKQMYRGMQPSNVVQEKKI